MRKWITAFLVSAVSCFTVTWYLMLGAGIARHEWLTGLPALSYWRAFPLALILNFILDAGALRHRYDEKAEAKS